jgi:intein/homing endonuclease
MNNKQKLLNNPEVAELLGCFIGDGWIESRGDALYIAGNPIEDKDHYDEFIAPIFSKYFINVKPRKFPYWRVYGVVTHRKRIISKAVNMGFQKGAKSKVAKIPNYIMNSTNSNLWRAVLRGIFDTDGSFYCKKAYGKYDKNWTKKYHCKSRIQFRLTSKDLIKQIGVLLKRLNIDFRTSRREGGFICKKKCSPSYILNIWKINCVNKWFKEIGSNNPRQITRYLIWKKYGFLPAYTNLIQRKEMLSGNLDPKNFYE